MKTTFHFFISFFSALLACILTLSSQLIIARYQMASEFTNKKFEKRVELVTELSKLEGLSFEISKLRNNYQFYQDARIITPDSKIPESVIQQIINYDLAKQSLLTDISLNYGEKVNKVIDILNQQQNPDIFPESLWYLENVMRHNLYEKVYLYSLWSDLWVWINIILLIITTTGLFYSIINWKSSNKKLIYLDHTLNDNLRILDEQVDMITNR